MTARSVAPWHDFNGAETGLLRLTYDPLLTTDDGPARRLGSAIADVAWGSDRVEISVRSGLTYSDGARVRTADLCLPLVALLRRCRVARYDLAIAEDRLTVAGLSRRRLEEILTLPVAVPFRPATPERGVLGSHPQTSGLFRFESAAAGSVVLRANDRHQRRPAVDVVVVTTGTDPERLLRQFLDDEIDVVPIGGEEYERAQGLAARGGTLESGPTNAISTLVVRATGALRDPGLRRTVARSVPRAEFVSKFLAGQGEAAHGFTAAARARRASANTRARAGDHRPLRLLVPPIERTGSRANWLASRFERTAGLRISVRELSWPDYWAAYGDADAGDMLWCGIGVHEDQPRDWVLGILNGTLALSPEARAAGRGASNASDEQLLATERQLLDEGWLIPLYKHRQCYLCRVGLRGIALEPTDWPLPGVRHAEDLRW
jgi:MarR-like DNA-binding transcriptional regulator SgrR of sgrS sRNA